MNKLRGKISTIGIVTTLVILAMATQTQAAETACPLLGNPQLTAGGICKIATGESTTLVCALIDPSKSAGEQLVSGQDLATGPLQVNWNITGGIGTVPLYKKSSVTINANTQYEVVVYDWNNATNCVKKTSISGSAITSSFNASAINPTNQNSQSNSGDGSSASGQNDSLKESAINMMEAILNITNPNGTTNQPTPQNPAENTPYNPSPIPSQAPNGQPINQSFAALEQLYGYVGNKVGVPSCVIEAVSYIEYPTVYNYSQSQINQYSQPGGRIPNCPWNSCSAAGHMQMTMGIDDRGSTSCNRCCWTNSKGVTTCQKSCPNAWTTYGNAITQYESTSHTPNVCNLLDSTYAGAKKLKSDSGTAAGDMNWTNEAYTRAGTRYYGNCTVKYNRLGNRTYCEYLAYNCSL